MKTQHSTTYFPTLDYALTMYTTAHLTKLETCQRDIVLGRDLSKTIPGRSAEWVRAAAEESSKAEQLADHLIRMSDEELIAYPLENLDDTSSTTLAQIMWERAMSESNRETSEALLMRNDEALVGALHSPQGSVLVDYDWLFSDTAENPCQSNDRDPIDILILSLAHNLAHDAGRKVPGILRHMASIYLASGEIEPGIRIVGELLKHDPRDFDTYHSAAIELSNLKCTSLALVVANRGLEMALETSSFSEEADDLAFHTECLKKHSTEDRVPPISPQTSSLLQKALQTPFDTRTHLSAQALVRRVIPEIDAIQVKRFPVPINESESEMEKIVLSG